MAANKLQHIDVKGDSLRKSSRGNPYHWPAGSPKGGQFATKENGLPSYHTDTYYEQRTNERFGRDTFGFDITEVDGNYHSNLKGSASSSYIHCGGFDRSKILPIGNGDSGEFFARKPIGGVWMSRSDAEYGWSKWCEENDELSWSKNPVELEIRNAKILHIYDEEDLKKLPRTSDKLTDIDYVKLSRFYDGIELNIKNLYNTMYGWDCDSTVIFNEEVLYEKKQPR